MFRMIRLLLLIFFLPAIWSEGVDYLTAKEENSLDDAIALLSDDDYNDMFEEDTDNNNDYLEKENWDCLDNEIDKKYRLEKVINMIKEGEEQIEQQGNKKEKTTLLLGDFGAGKTTLVQFLAGNEKKLMSKDDGSNSAHYIIDDSEKIGHSSEKPVILYPEQAVIDSESSFTDTPGFSVMRNERREIGATYFLKKYLQDIKYIKIVILTMYHSLEYGMYNGDFTNLLYNIINFIKDIDKYKDSFVLIATKVPPMFNIINGNMSPVSDARTIESIASYIIKVKNALILKLKNRSFSSGTEFLKKAITIIDYLLERDENGVYKRINIFRRPTESGPISNMTVFKRAKVSLQKTIFNNIKYTKFDHNDFSYQLPEKSKNYLECLLLYVNENIRKMSQHIFNSIKNHYQLEVKETHDIYKVRSQLEVILRKLKLFKNDLKGSTDYENYLSVIRNFLNNESLIIDQTAEFYQLDGRVVSLEQFTNINLTALSHKWFNQIEKLYKYIENHLSRCEYLIKIFESFSSYDIQKSKSNYLTKNSLPKTKHDFNYLLNAICEKSQFKDHQLHTILSEIIAQNTTADIDEVTWPTLLSVNNISCDEGKLIVKGNYITLSEICNGSEIITNYCGGKPFRKVLINAFLTVFIDTDLNDTSFRGVNMMIAAPKWEVIGKRTLDLSGIRGKSYTKSRAKDGDNFNDVGQDGLPGYPGGNGGNFLGIGLEFLHEDNLTINVNGGDGGPGQNGGHGKDGLDGTGGYEKLFVHQPRETNYSALWKHGFKETQYGSSVNMSDALSELRVEHCSISIKVYRQSGECGSPGGQGGNGGVGGLGGKTGEVTIISLDKFSKINVTADNGNTGRPGKGGNAGKVGKIGKTIECFKTAIHEDSHTLICNATEKEGIKDLNEPICSAYSPQNEENFWVCRYINESYNCPQPVLKFGISNHTKTGILSPEIPKKSEFLDDIMNYTLMLEESGKNKFLSNYTNRLLDELKKKFQ